MPTREPSAAVSSSSPMTTRSGSSAGMTTSAVRVLSVLAGNSQACGFLAARISPVSRSARTYETWAVSGGAGTPAGRSLTTPVVASRGPPTTCSAATVGASSGTGLSGRQVKRSLLPSALVVAVPPARTARALAVAREGTGAVMRWVGVSPTAHGPVAVGFGVPAASAVGTGPTVPASRPETSAAHAKARAIGARRGEVMAPGSLAPHPSRSRPGMPRARHTGSVAVC